MENNDETFTLRAMNITDLLADRDGFVRLLAQVRGFSSAAAMVEKETGIRLDRVLSEREVAKVADYLKRLRMGHGPAV